jgi:hypothetical protein
MNKKQFNQLKVGDTIFLVGSPDFITHEDLVETFGLFTIKTIIPTLNGKREPIICLGGEYFGIIPDPTVKKVAYFIAPEGYIISGYQASIRLDEWSEKFTKTISEYQTFLCFPDVNSGLDFLELKFGKYLEDIKESREINKKAIEK